MHSSPLRQTSLPLRTGPKTRTLLVPSVSVLGRGRGARALRSGICPRSELPRVRRWIRRARAETAFGWGQAGLVRRIFAPLKKARLKRADTDTAQGAANAAEPGGRGRAGKSPASRRRLRPLRDEVKPR